MAPNPVTLVSDRPSELVPILKGHQFDLRPLPFNRPDRDGARGVRYCELAHLHGVPIARAVPGTSPYGHARTDSNVAAISEPDRRTDGPPAPHPTAIAVSGALGVCLHDRFGQP